MNDDATPDRDDEGRDGPDDDGHDRHDDGHGDGLPPDNGDGDGDGDDGGHDHDGDDSADSADSADDGDPFDDDADTCRWCQGSGRETATMAYVPGPDPFAGPMDTVTLPTLCAHCRGTGHYESALDPTLWNR